jgi:hypothetical protein
MEDTDNKKKQSIYVLNCSHRWEHKRFEQNNSEEMENIHVRESKGCPSCPHRELRHGVSRAETGKMVLHAGVLISRG